MKREFFLLGLFVGEALAIPLFVRGFGGTSEDGALSITYSSDGGYALAGYTQSFGAGLNDCLVLKLTSLGCLQWARTLGGTNDDWSCCVVQSTDGGYALAGRTNSFGAGGYDFLVLKLTSSGDIEWAKTFGGAGYDYASSIIQSSEGSYIVVGSTNSFGAGSYDILILKLDPTGNLVWAKVVGGASYDRGYSVIQVTDGGYVLTGSTNSFGAGSYDILLLKLDPSGNLVWAKALGGPTYDEGYSVIQTSDGAYLVGGYTRSFGAGLNDFLVSKIDPVGNPSWTRTVGGTDSDEAEAVIQVWDGSFVVAGGARSFGSGNNYDILVSKLDPAGNHIWASRLGGNSYDRAQSLVGVPGEGVMVAGYGPGFSQSAADFILATFDDMGGSCLGVPVSPTITSPNLTVTSISPSVASVNPTATSPNLTALSPNIAVTTHCPLEVEEDISVPDLHMVIRGSFAQISLPAPGNLILYDISGRSLRTWELEAGSWSIAWDTGLASGVYILELRCEEKRIAEVCVKGWE